jgi:hypothetical protein
MPTQSRFFRAIRVCPVTPPRRSWPRAGPAPRVTSCRSQPPAPVEIEDLSAGRWRIFACESAQRWPAVCAPFERTKYLFTFGDGQRYFAKFEGLSAAPGHAVSTCEAHAQRVQRRADAGFGPRPLLCAHGFLIMPWLQARPLCRADQDARLLAEIGAYIALGVEPRPSTREQAGGVERLSDMLRINLRSALPWRAEQLTQRASELRPMLPSAPLGYGDGHLAPHEWLRCDDGRLVKSDCSGHSLDHTCVGRQAVLWDLAATCVEWQLDVAGIETLLSGYRAAGGELAAAEVLEFYQLAYAAFRLGQLMLCESLTSDPQERTRLREAIGRITAALS